MTEEQYPALTGRSILVVEDERLIALDIQDLLVGWGCRVVGPVATAEAALALIGNETPDAGILDVQLTDHTSEPVAAAFRSRGWPFLVLTAFQRAHLTGALQGAPLLNKPVHENRLLQELADLLRSPEGHRGNPLDPQTSGSNV